MEDLALRSTEQRASDAELARQAASDHANLKGHDNTQRAVVESTKASIRHREDVAGRTKKVEVVNHPKPPTQIATPDVAKLIPHLESLLKAIQGSKIDPNAWQKPLQEVVAALQKLPKDLPKMPEFPSTLGVNNLEALKPYFEEIVSALNAKDLQVSVAAPEVNVAAPDLTELNKRFTAIEKGQAAIVKAIGAIKIPEPAPVDLVPLMMAQTATTDAIKGIRFPIPNVVVDPLIQYTPADIDDASTVKYFGFTDRVGNWYIRKFDESVSPKTLRFAWGNDKYADAWTNRATQTYNYWGRS